MRAANFPSKSCLPPTVPSLKRMELAVSPFQGNGGQTEGTTWSCIGICRGGRKVLASVHYLGVGVVVHIGEYLAHIDRQINPLKLAFSAWMFTRAIYNNETGIIYPARYVIGPSFFGGPHLNLTVNFHDRQQNVPQPTRRSVCQPGPVLSTKIEECLLPFFQSSLYASIYFLSKICISTKDQQQQSRYSCMSTPYRTAYPVRSAAIRKPRKSYASRGSSSKEI